MKLLLLPTVSLEANLSKRLQGPRPPLLLRLPQALEATGTPQRSEAVSQVPKKKYEWSLTVECALHVC